MSKRAHQIYITFFFTAAIIVTFYFAIKGFSYYTTPINMRFWNPDHNSLKPSGFIGHGTGIIGSLMMIVGVSFYMIRKRFRGFFHLGILKYWLEFHIFLCTLGPILVLYHTAFKFGGIVSVSFWSMVAVVISGVIGRFIYIQIPRSIQGQELSIKEINEINDDLTFKLRTEIKIDENFLLKLDDMASINKYKNLSTINGLVIIFTGYFHTKSLIHRLKKEIKSKHHQENISQIIRIVKIKLILSRRIGLLRTMQNLFKYWHVIHLPVAMVMFVIMMIHIIVAITFGYRWIF